MYMYSPVQRNSTSVNAGGCRSGGGPWRGTVVSIAIFSMPQSFEEIVLTRAAYPYPFAIQKFILTRVFPIVEDCFSILSIPENFVFNLVWLNPMSTVIWCRCSQVMLDPERGPILIERDGSVGAQNCHVPEHDEHDLTYDENTVLKKSPAHQLRVVV